MDIALGILAIVAVVVAVVVLAERISVPAPLFLMVVGVGASFIPGIPEIHLSSDVVLLGFLPPLLYAAAIRTSVIDFRANLRAIGYLSVLLVIVTSFGIGLLTWLILPVPPAVAFSFGAVVAPPDAVAATSVARRVGLPRKLVTILEGESLVNDATAITCLRAGIAAIGGTATVGGISLAFVLAVGVGLLVGLVVALLAGVIRKHTHATVLDTAISLMVPFAAYLPAEELHGSGVIAVVTAGLYLGHRSPVIQAAQSRLSERINWTTIQFLLENAVFLLIGLQARWILNGLAQSSVPGTRIAGFCEVIFAGVIVIRIGWLAAGRLFLFRGQGRNESARRSWPETLIIGWAGMRGVVTLAVAFLLPPDIQHRDILLFGAMVVVVGTLLLQGLTLPVLARRLGVRGPDPREDALQLASVLHSSANAAIRRLDEEITGAELDATISTLRERIRSRSNGIWERLGTEGDTETPSEEYRRLRLNTLHTERDEILRIRSTGKVDHEVIGQALSALDVEESMLNQGAERAETLRVRQLESPFDPADACQHLHAAPTVVAPKGPGICLECERDGTRPVHLRLCLDCGHVGCCDSSVGRHASLHFASSHHPVMRSFETGETWRWCYVDELLG